MNFEDKELKRRKETITKLIIHSEMGKLKLAMRSELDMDAFTREIIPPHTLTRSSLKYRKLSETGEQLCYLLKDSKIFQMECLTITFDAMLTMLECKSEVNKTKMSKLSKQCVETLLTFDSKEFAKCISHWANDDGDKPHPWYHWINTIVNVCKLLQCNI